MSDNSGSAQYGTSGVHNNVVFKSRVTFLIFHALVYNSCTQSHSLVELHIFTYNGSLADYHTGTVVNKKMPSDHCAGMYINSGFTVSVFGYHTGKKRDIQFIQPVCKPVYGNGIKAGIIQNNAFS